MLIQEASETNPLNMRRRKQGTTVRHPLDLIDINIHHFDRGKNDMNVTEINESNNTRPSWFSSLKRTGLFFIEFYIYKK